MSEKILCHECGEDIGSVYYNESDNEVCADCYDDLTFTCCFCEEVEFEKYQHVMTVVFDADEAGIETGIYKVLKMPYYTQGLIGSGWLHKWSLEKISDLPPDALKNYDYPCGHLCRECQNKITTPKLKS